MTSRTRAWLVTGLLTLTACSTFKSRQDLIPENGQSSDQARPIQENEVSSEDVERNIEKPYKSVYGEIAMDDNEMVQKWVRYFQGRGRGYMQQYLERSGRYLPMMKNVLRENGLPEDLVYIALIESGFSPRAHSRANAVGYWQFIRSTGKRFGLAVDPFLDERRDPVLSTRAAAEYFKTLYGMFGSWHLSMAAYNVGEARVKRAVNRYYTKNFWELIKKRRSFPAETKNYVPKFIAAAMIAKDLESYGFADVEYADPLSYDTVALQSPISLSKLASNISVDVDELKLLNPKFRTDFVPISRGAETVVRIPVGRATDAVAALSMSVTSVPKIVQAENFYYRIRRGDNLSTVARKHRTTVSQLRRLNGLSNRTILRVGQTIKVPDHGGDGVQYVMEDSASSRTPSGAVHAVDTRESAEFHVVKRGENLTVISQRYGVSLDDIRRLNKLGQRSVVRRGQRLRIKESVEKRAGEASSRSRNISKAKALQGEIPRTNHKVASSSRRKHTVRRGETLYDVSRRYGVTISAMARANSLSVNHRVMAGERLIVPD